MKTIWKFPVSITDLQAVAMPVGAQILTIQMQHETPCLWAIVDSEAETENRFIVIHGTGHPVHADHGAYIGTFQFRGLVFHAFESARRPLESN